MPANLLYTLLRCPRCGWAGDTEVEVEIDGRGHGRDYHVGDRIEWLSGRRPADGSLIVDGYVECSNCHRDYFVVVSVMEDQLVTVEIDHGRAGYVPDPA